MSFCVTLTPPKTGVRYQLSTTVNCTVFMLQLFVRCQRWSELTKATVMYTARLSLLTVILYSREQQKCPHSHSSVSCIFHCTPGNVNRGIHLELLSHIHNNGDN